jgi:hypothetical protein
VGKKLELEPLEARIQKRIEFLDDREDDRVTYMSKMRETLKANQRPYEFWDKDISESSQRRSEHFGRAKEYEQRQEQYFSTIIAALKSVLNL